MSTHKKPPGHIHKIREFELEKIILSDEFDILQIVGEGWFGKILLVEHRATDTEMVLKALPKPYVSLRDFYREFHFGLHLGVHRNIVTTYDVAFETAGFYIFTQEYAPLGDLTSNVADSGIGELHSKRVAKQIASALDYMHAKEIVHRDVKLDNVLIYKSDFSRVKLCDFGESYKTGSIVERRNEWLPYSPPEVLQIQPEGTYEALPSHDVWQFAIVIFVCLTGCLPWQKASTDDPRYARYLAWQNINMMIPLRRTPKLFKLLTTKASRMFRKFLEPRPDRRPKTLIELNRFLDDRWLAKGSEKDMAEFEPDELCPSMYSFHSSPEEKNRVLWSLAEQGIETTVDRREKKIRIKNWIESSVIMEDEEEEDSGSASASPSSSVSREPVPGHISSVRAENEAEKARQKTINTTIKDASQKHFDPRTGQLQQGPSEMGTIYRSLSNLSTATTAGQSLNSSLLTLGSRNNLIMSEGNPYQLDFNNFDDNLLDDDGMEIQRQQKMVNQQLIKQFVSSNYNYSNNNSNAPNTTTSTFSISNNYNNNNINDNGNNNKYKFHNNNSNLLYHTLSDPNLTDTQDNSNNIIYMTNKKLNHNNDSINNDMKLTTTTAISRTTKPLQRTRSDSLKKIFNFKNSNFKSSTNDLFSSTKTMTLIDIDIDNDNFYQNINNFNNTQQQQQSQQSLEQLQQQQQQQQNQFLSASDTININSQKNNNNVNLNAVINNSNSNNNINSNNVSKFGLMSAFKSIATISVPEYNNNSNNQETYNTTEEQQFQNNSKQKTDNSNTKLTQLNKNFNLHKDSGYGSYDRVNITTTNNISTTNNIKFNNEKYLINKNLKTINYSGENDELKKTKSQPQIYSNINKEFSTISTSTTKQNIISTANTTTQTTQTQYGARKKNFNEIYPSSTSTMKDTPYDRINTINSNLNKTKK